MTRALRRVRCTDDEGFTLVELIVAMTILVVFFAVFSTIATKVFSTTRKQQTRSASVDVSRNVLQVLDRQVRYANAVNTPVTTGDGTQWVEWRTGSIGKQQTCYQWRVTPTGLAQYRTWLPPSAVAKPWATAGSQIGSRSGAPIFAVVDPSAPAEQSRQKLTVSFLAGAGSGRDGAPTRVSLTALNTKSANAPITPICTEVPRS